MLFTIILYGIASCILIFIGHYYYKNFYLNDTDSVIHNLIRKDVYPMDVSNGTHDGIKNDVGNNNEKKHIESTENDISQDSIIKNKHEDKDQATDENNVGNNNETNGIKKQEFDTKEDLDAFLKSL